MKKNEIPTPRGVRTYWETDYCLAMDFTEEDWGEFCGERDEIMLNNFKDAQEHKGDKDEDPKRVL